MAKKDNFDFETESKVKLNLNFDFLKNLTKQQKGVILAAVIGVLVIVAVVVTILLLNPNSQSPNGGNNIPGSNNNNTPGTENDGGTSGEGTTEVPDVITDFYISSKPNQTLYYMGDEQDWTGLTVYFKSEQTGSVYVSYSDDPESFIITGFDSSTPSDELVITVKFREFTDTFTVTVLEKDIAKASLVGITVDPLPQTTYKVGESFKHTGGYIVAEYSDGTFETIKLRMKHVSGYGAIANTPGEHEITISYSDDHGGYAETKITITIVE